MFRYVLLILGAIFIGVGVDIVCLRFGLGREDATYVEIFITVGIAVVVLPVIFTIEERNSRD
jgi:uncharacterized membrane protein